MDTSRMSEGIELARVLMADAPAGLVVDTHDLCPEMGAVLRSCAALGADLGGRVLLNAVPGVYDGRYVVAETRAAQARRVSLVIATEACARLRAVAPLAGAQFDVATVAGEDTILVTLDRPAAALCAAALAHAASVLATMGTPDRLPDADRMLALAGALTDAVAS